MISCVPFQLPGGFLTHALGSLSINRNELPIFTTLWFCTIKAILTYGKRPSRLPRHRVLRTSLPLPSSGGTALGLCCLLKTTQLGSSLKSHSWESNSKPLALHSKILILQSYPSYTTTNRIWSSMVKITTGFGVFFFNCYRLQGFLLFPFLTSQHHHHLHPMSMI